MQELTQADWARIAASPKFIELSRRKLRFLFGWWFISIAWFFMIPLGSGYLPDLFNIKIIGNINLVYTLVIITFFLTFWLNYHYSNWANNVSDPLTDHVVQELLDSQASADSKPAANNQIHDRR